MPTPALEWGVGACMLCKSVTRAGHVFPFAHHNLLNPDITSPPFWRGPRNTATSLNIMWFWMMTTGLVKIVADMTSGRGAKNAHKHDKHLDSPHKNGDQASNGSAARTASTPAKAKKTD